MVGCIMPTERKEAKSGFQFAWRRAHT